MMEHKTLHKITERICENLYEYAERGFTSTSDIGAVKNLLSSYIKIKTIELMEVDGEAERYSEQFRNQLELMSKNATDYEKKLLHEVLEKL